MAKRTVLITGCSEGGMGAALASAFHAAGLHVIATARNPSKMDSLTAAGIETMPLDILSEASIRECVGKLPSLDVLVNNAGVGLQAPLSDMSMAEAKGVFDVNVWAPIAMIQACLPLLLQSDSAVIVNHGSVSSVIPIPFQSAYNASKAALALISDTIRVEMEAFDVKVVELKTGHVRTNFLPNLNEDKNPMLAKGSIYEPAREKVDRMLRSEQFNGTGMLPEAWATAAVSDILKKNPPRVIYRGDSAWGAKWLPMLPLGVVDDLVKRTFGMGVVNSMLKTKR